ncbi:arylamine N-acetyltransferase [Mycobacterium kansasii]|uniref:Arylamine N-acetyltransferase n=1 Tax=Mycobacterium kansasii TaxID=1768 RepID=A0A1V3X1X3_MYCKA|nr:arylamine N-acetyltransferase [Mycobacterium kansasii]
MTLDLNTYFERIGYRGPTEPTLAVLRAVVSAHTRAIPFENLDPLMGVPVDDLSPESLMDKLVHRRRGGYCYEHNGLIGEVLAELGFRPRRLAGRVVWMAPPDAPLPAQTHTVLAVTFPGSDGPYLVDVGFGARRRRRRCGCRPDASSKRRMNRIGSTTAATGWCCRRWFATSGSRSMNSARSAGRRST